MTAADVADVERITSTAFHNLDVATRPANWPMPEPRSPDRREAWRRRVSHVLQHDGPGCWVADDEAGELIGAAASLLREGMWGLTTFGVMPGIQARGVGRQLLASALSYAPASAPGIICSSHDPRAIRLYRLAGFDIHPAMLMWGKVRRAALPAIDKVREGDASDFGLLDEIDRGCRGYGHGSDHAVMLSEFRLRVVERASSRGYAYHHPGGGPYMLAASDRDAASLVLWDALAASAEDTVTDMHNLTGSQAWAIDIGLAAGLELHNRGYLALRAMAPPVPYIPSGHFL
jgi:GNAT superfamily N-acetyltransferase